MDAEFGSELLKMFREALGARVTQIAIWILVFIGVITAIPHVMRKVEEIVTLSKGEVVDWESAVAVILAVGVVAFTFAIIGILLGFLIRIGGWMLYRSEINQIKNDIAAIKKRLDDMDTRE